MPIQVMDEKIAFSEDADYIVETRVKRNGYLTTAFYKEGDRVIQSFTVETEGDRQYALDRHKEICEMLDVKAEKE